MPEDRRAKRFFVSGTVQGVGFRFFVDRAARRLSLSGYVRNLRDGRVEVYAVGPEAALKGLQEDLDKGPAAAIVTSVAEEDARVDPRYAGAFTIEFDSW